MKEIKNDLTLLNLLRNIQVFLVAMKTIDDPNDVLFRKIRVLET